MRDVANRMPRLTTYCHRPNIEVRNMDDMGLEKCVLFSNLNDSVNT